MEAMAVKVELEHLGDLPLPAILHWNFDHFMVLERLGKDRAFLVDPAEGRVTVDLKEVSRRFTGVAVVMEPDAAFQPRPFTRPSLARYRGLLRSCLAVLAMILGASLIIQIAGMVFPVANQLLVDQVILPKREAWLWPLAVSLGLALVVRTMVSLVRSWAIQNLQRAMDLSLMGKFMEHLLQLPLTFFLQRKPGDLFQRVQTNATVRALFTSQSVATLLDGFLLTAYLALMMAYNSLLGAVVLAIGVVRAALLLVLKDRNQQFMSAELAASGQEGQALVEALSALETVKAGGTEAVMVGRWSTRMIHRVNASLLRRRVEIGSTQVMVFLQGLGTAAIFWLGGREVVREHMTLGVFASFLTLQALFMGPLESLLTAAGQLQFLNNHLARLDDVLETAPEPRGLRDPGRLRGAIRLENVSFQYSLGSPMVLEDISLEIRPGEKVALVGPSGAGKSTLARLLMGMHLPTRGVIRFDGADLRDLELPRVRNQMGVVLQETFFFNDTVRANLSLNDPDLPMERIRDAAKRACVLDVVDARPQGFASLVGENGGSFSGGQRQRLSLARALAHDPSILLLDEATSSLDLELEAALHANLASMGCTRVVIAHRLATVEDADHILVLDGGRLVQRGTFKTLSREPGLFRDLALAMEATHG
jgi:ABC-type bacteriocin/lantibiotic exporter with double-glycine peptidase domain